VSRRSSSDGLRSEPLRAALASALSGGPEPLEDLLRRHGDGHLARPNLRLAEAFGAEFGQSPPAALRLLQRLGANDAAPDTPDVFLPIAAAYGWVAFLRAGRDVAAAWAALGALAGDERTPVRLGTLHALTSLAVRPGGGRQLLAQAMDWLELDDRELCFGAAGVVVELFGDRQSLASLTEPGALLEYLSRVLAAVAGAPRSAERSDARRRLLLALPRTLAAVAAQLRAGERGAAWLEEECRSARHPDVREALSNAVRLLADKSSGQAAVLADSVRAALEGSAKPPRDPTRIRPGAARGRSSRPIR
jgi:hypothetical protein